MIILHNMRREYLKKRYNYAIQIIIYCNEKFTSLNNKTNLPPPLHCQMMVAKDNLSSGFVHPIEAMLLVPLLQ